MNASSPAPVPTGALRLTDWGLIQATGPDAANFLHGQLTQDIAGLGTGHARLAGYCSAKGRLLASFIVWRHDRETLLLACSADLLAPTLKRLQMFVMRAKCKLSDASASLALYGLVGAEALAWPGSEVPATPWTVVTHGADAVVRLPDAQGQPRGLRVQAADVPAPALPALDAAAWRRLEVHSGVARIVAATAEQFVPQMVNLELVGGVNFQKGCYPGQEVVARSQYRGTLKRRTMLFDTTAELAPGQEVFHSADSSQPAGRVVLAAGGSELAGCALVEVKLAALEGGSLHVGAIDGPALSRCALPYPIPSEAA